MSTVLRVHCCLALLLFAVSAGCAASADHSRNRAAMTPEQPRIQLLGFPGCPNTPAMRRNLRAALDAIGRGWTFTDTNQEALPESDTRRGWPTPTILVNGRDLFGMPPPVGDAMGCRIYPGGVPDSGTIGDRLRALADTR